MKNRKIVKKSAAANCNRTRPKRVTVLDQLRRLIRRFKKAGLPNDILEPLEGSKVPS